MSLVSSHQEGDVVIVNITGHVDASNAGELESELNALIGKGISKLVMNFERVKYISSAGLRVLLSVQKRLKPRSGDLKLCQMSPEVERIFTLAGFNRLFQIEKGLADTVSQF